MHSITAMLSGPCCANSRLVRPVVFQLPKPRLGPKPGSCPPASIPRSLLATAAAAAATCLRMVINPHRWTARPSESGRHRRPSPSFENRAVASAED